MRIDGRVTMTIPPVSVCKTSSGYCAAPAEAAKVPESPFPRNPDYQTRYDYVAKVEAEYHFTQGRLVCITACHGSHHIINISKVRTLGSCCGCKELVRGAS
jgi:hypothetical protein